LTVLEVLRLAIGVAAVFVLPGLAWSLALVPRQRPFGGPPEPGTFDWLERTGVTPLLSVAVVAVGGLAWSGLAGLPLDPWGATSLVAVLVASGLVVWRLRLRRVS
jgi:hypothetical protein